MYIFECLVFFAPLYNVPLAAASSESCTTAPCGKWSENVFCKRGWLKKKSRLAK